MVTQERIGEMHAILSWHEDPKYTDISSGFSDTLPDDPQVIYEHIPLNGTFVDNGVYLTYTGHDGRPINVSHLVERYGAVNTDKAGEYVLKYFCEYKSWCRVYENTALSKDLRWKKYRKIIVYEPNWLITTTPQIYQTLYPVFNHIIQRYQDIYWELNYKCDNVRSGIKTSDIFVTKYRNDWEPPIGRAYAYEENKSLWYICGYTYKDGDCIEIDFSGNEDFNNKDIVLHNLIVFAVNQEDLWSADESQYTVGSWVQFLDKIYVCHKSHQVVQDKQNKIKPMIIYPVNSDYWTLGCRVELAKYEYNTETLQRNTNPEVKDFIDSSIFQNIADKTMVKTCSGYPVRLRNIVIDSQGFLYAYHDAPV